MAPRVKSTKTAPPQQGAWTWLAKQARAQIRFLYDKFPDGEAVDRYVSDFDCHAYYPRELELLFRFTGFHVEARYGDYDRHPFRSTSRQVIMVGRKQGCVYPAAASPDGRSGPTRW